MLATPRIAIGGTPLVRLEKLVPPDAAEVLVKLEFYSPTGSYKDRMAWAIVEQAEARGDLRPGMTVVEFTGGSTGSSLAFVCAVKGYRFRAVSSDAFSEEKLRTMRAFGAEVIVVPSSAGQITPDLFVRMREKVMQLLQEGNAYWTDQFNNHDALVGYAALGRELLSQAPGPIDAFCAGVGTGGLLAGVAQALREGGSSARIVALEPATSPAMTAGHGGAHHVEGTAAGFVPPLVQSGVYDEARAIDEALARQTARRLAREEGIFTGTSSGMNVAAALALARELGPGKRVATVAVDSGLKYLAGDLYQA
jgi:cysteine synthase A